ncbi:MAG: CopG family transcriptional regulator [Actinobacteria bacterium]|nr:CopG family transcriptional regulator [Actinomycetota bacterium]
MKRTQIQLTEKQYKILKEISSERNISLAEVVREAITCYSAASVSIDKDTKIKDALSVIGKYNSGKSDISINHDDYLQNIFAEKTYKGLRPDKKK